MTQRNGTALGREPGQGSRPGGGDRTGGGDPGRSGDERAFWAGLRAGRSVARRREELAGIPVDFACAVDDLDVDAAVGGRSVWRMARFVKLALIAARQAVADAGLDPRPGSPAGWAWCSGWGSAGSPYSSTAR